MNVMGVAEAAMALIDDDEQEGVHRFFSALAGVYIDYISRMNACFKIVFSSSCMTIGAPKTLRSSHWIPAGK